MLYLNLLVNFVNIQSCHLTLTNVVFEFLIFLYIFQFKIYLTLTNVVFEFCSFESIKFIIVNLTLTNVVFEWTQIEK